MNNLILAYNYIYKKKGHLIELVKLKVPHCGRERGILANLGPSKQWTSYFFITGTLYPIKPGNHVVFTNIFH